MPVSRSPRHRRVWRGRAREAVGLRVRRWRADALLVSFPKCGRTWLRLMIGEAFNAHFELGADIDTRLELFGLWKLGRRVPAIYARHEDAPHMKTRDELEPSRRQYRRDRIILLVRDPRDAIVSMYFEASKRVKRRARYDGSLSEFVREERGSTLAFIAYYNLWAAARHVPRGMLLVRYEDLHADPANELRRVLAFVGVHDVRDDVIEAAVLAASFSEMRALEEGGAVRSGKLKPGARGDAESYKTREGRVGGHRDVLSPVDRDWMDAQVALLDPWFGYSIGTLSPRH